MSGEFELDEATLRAIFNRRIRPAFSEITPEPASDRPVLVVVGAQPGAGKSRAIERVRSDRRGAVEVIGDDLRVFHPRYDDLMETNPVRMPTETAQASGAWVEMSIQYLRDQRRSVLLETTMRQPPVVEATLEAFRAAGYRIEVRALTVPLEVSRLGTVTRYVEQVRHKSAGRWTPSAAHEEAGKRMPHTLAAVIGKGLVDRIIVQDRAGRILHDLDVDVSRTAVTDGLEARNAVEAGRRLGALDSAQARSWLDSFDTVAQFCASPGQTDPDLVSTVHRIAQDARGSPPPHIRTTSEAVLTQFSEHSTSQHSYHPSHPVMVGPQKVTRRTSTPETERRMPVDRGRECDSWFRAPPARWRSAGFGPAQSVAAQVDS